MYSIIQDIIDHAWITTNAGDQQYIYMICCVLICVSFAVLTDLIYRIFRHFWR